MAVAGSIMAQYIFSPEYYGYKITEDLAVFSAKPRDRRPLPADVDVQSATDDAAEDDPRSYFVEKPYYRTLCEDPRENLRYLYKPLSDKYPLDLTLGILRRTEKNTMNEHISLLLECLKKHSIKPSKGEFVCKRSCLQHIGTSLYDCENITFDRELKIAVQKYKGVYFICEFKQPQDLMCHEQLNSYSGLKFESYVTSEKGKKPKHKGPLDFNYDFNIVVKARLKFHSLIVSGEVDCCLEEDNSYVELKTNWQAIEIKEYKCVSWWMQSYLLGVRHVYCGFKNKQLKVTYCDKFSLPELKQKISPKKPGPRDYMDYIDTFLTNVRRNVVKELVPYVYIRPQGERQFNEVKKNIECKFLPLWLFEDGLW